jgi:elongation factor G
MDKIGADYENAIKTIHNRLGVKAYPINYPIGSESEFKGVVDIVEQKAYLYDGSINEITTEIPIPANLVDKIKQKRSELIDALAEFSDELAELFIMEEEIPVELIRKTIRKGTLEVKFFPCLCGSSFKNKGVKFVIDAAVDYLPAPTDIESVVGQDSYGNEVVRHPSDDEPFTALAFKVMTDPYVGKLTFFRVYSGKLEKGSYVKNTTKDVKERFGRILRMHANDRVDIDAVYAGEIAAVVGLKGTTTGDTLAGEKDTIILESMNFPEPVINVAIEPKTKADQDKMAIALQKLGEEDPTFKTHTDKETGQVIIAGMGELHLEIIVDRMRREFKVEATVREPQVSYRETLTKECEVEGKFVRQSGGKGQYGHVRIKFEPNPGKGFEFVDKIVGGVIPFNFIPAVKKGIEESLENGIIANYPMVDIKATLYDGSYHEVDSSEMAFKVAASLALKETKTKGNPVLLEPIMDVEVVSPNDYVGNVIGDLTSRRGRIESQEGRGNAVAVRAYVPLSEMFGYATSLRSNTQGRATFMMQFARYDKTPKSIGDEIIKNRGSRE